MKTPLSEITVTCTRCGEDATAQDINDDIERFHLPNGKIARFPSIGLTPDDITTLPSLRLVCECCHEDDDDS